jgi:hypothetical protein
MKIVNRLSLFVILFLGGTVLYAQTADDVIARYLDAVGGKKVISSIKSMYVEGTMDIMGMEATTKTTTLSGKGVKMEMDMMGSTVVNCITDESGWTINPFMGGTGPTDLPEEQYNMAKEQIRIGAPFIDYAERGYKAELLGEETIGDAKTVKIKMTSPDNIVTEHFFDKESGYLIRSAEPGEMGQNVSTFSDYREIGGYIMPYKIEVDAGGQAMINATYNKVELNVPVDESIFAKPE